ILLKPINVEDLVSMTERIAANREQRRKERMLTKQIVKDLKETTAEFGCSSVLLEDSLAAIVGIGGIGIFSDKIKETIRLALKFHGDRDMPVLIQGETGTGKEVVARLIHYGLSDSEAPFVDINCAALTPSLFESELFGYEAGAYTGALIKGSKGKLDMASKGTLFFDEIGELSIDLQAKLLRMIEDKEYYRVGGLKKIKADVRIICATNKNLEKSLEQGLFRSDLFYRLNVGRLHPATLRERREEIVPLAVMFLNEFAQKRGKKFESISDKAGGILTSYYWPGNVRELRNTLEWIVFKYDEAELKPEHLSDIIRRIHPEVPVLENCQQISAMDPFNFSLPFDGLSLEDYVDNIVCRALEFHNGNKAQTARYLGISRRTLYCRLDRMRQSAQPL
ncbi:MAG: sigma-54 dependent transcriptional regulator, partial [Firmicutes bacterium]|nr:sigma-54 dependent transcriptional regulator [Bacillota bacterium]